MNTRGERIKIAPGIWRDRYGIATTVKVGELPQKEKRWPFDTSIKTMKAWQDETRVALRARASLYRRGTFGRDVRDYLTRVKPNHIDERAYKERKREINAWLPRFDARSRFTITKNEINQQLEEWRTTLSAQTCRLRRMALGHLYATLDGKSMPNIVRDTIVHQKPDPTPKALPLVDIDTALDELAAGTKTQARLRLMRWTAMRPSQQARLRLANFKLTDRIPHVVVPRGKKGRVVRIPFVGPRALKAAREFIRICATPAVLHEDATFPAWSQPSANRLLADACERAGVQRFNLYRIKHSVGSLLRGVMDLADVQYVYGHIDSDTSEIYAPPIPEKIVEGFRHLDIVRPRKAVKRKRRRADRRAGRVRRLTAPSTTASETASGRRRIVALGGGRCRG